MTLFNELKSIAKILQEAGKIEQYQQILDTQNQLLEMQKKIAELELDNKQLREEFKIKEALVPKNDMYWILKDDIKDGPFCTCCWDSERNLIRLHTNSNSGKIYCPKCSTVAKAGTAAVFTPQYRRNPGR